MAHDGKSPEKKCCNCNFGKSDSDLQMYPFKLAMPGNVTVLQMVESIINGKISLKMAYMCIEVNLILYENFEFHISRYAQYELQDHNGP